MEFKKLISAALMLGAITFGATTASAFGTYMTSANGVLGTSYTSPNGCIACHSAANNTGNDKGVTPLAATWKSVGLAGLAAADSDGDGFTNLQEATASLTTYDYNSATVTPFTQATGGLNLGDMYIIGDPSASQAAFADPYGLATAGKEILGGVSVTVQATPVTVFAKLAGADATWMMYSLDVNNAGTLLVQGTDWMINANGSFTVAGGGPVPAKAVIVRNAPVVSVPAAGGSSGGCVTSAATTPLMMVIAMLTLGFFVRRKKD